MDIKLGNERSYGRLTIYGLYKGDKFIDVGTAQEIAERQGITPQTVKYLAHSKREKLREEKNKKSLIAVVVEQIKKMPTDEEGRKEYMRQYRKRKQIELKKELR